MKTLLYCTKAKPYLYEVDAESGSKYFVENKDYGEDNLKMNGLVCFECECEEAFKYTTKGTEGRMYLSGSYLSNFELLERSCLTNEKLNGYGKGKDLYAIHLENVHLTEPFHITQLYRDGTMVYPLTRAPQSYCFAYRKLETTKEDYLSNVGKADGRYYFQKNGKFFYSEKVLVLSIQSPWLCKIGNGEKDLEVRKGCPKGLEIK